MDITPTNISTLNRSSVTVWKRGAASYDSFAQRLAAQTTTTTGEAIYSWLGAMPALKLFLKELEFATLASNRWSVKTQEWGIGWNIKKLEIIRDLYGQYAPMFEQNGLLATVHPDKLLAERLVAGFVEKGYTGGAFFSANQNHATGVAKNKFTNFFTKQLTPTYFGQAIASMGKILAPDGTPFNLVKKWVLLCGEDNRSAAEDILELETLSGGGKNKYYKRAELEVTPFITGSHWFLINQGMPFKGMVQVNEIPITFTAKTDPQSDSVFRTESFDYKSYGVLAVDYGLPQVIWGSTGADA